jgi:hypothetical protein
MQAEETGTLQKSNVTTIPRADFPPLFPFGEYDGLEPFKKLENAERLLLAGLVSNDILERLKVVHE